MNRGEQHHGAKLDATKVAEMRRLYWEQGFCLRCIAKMHQTKYTTAWDAINFQTWKHVK